MKENINQSPQKVIRDANAEKDIYGPNVMQINFRLVTLDKFVPLNPHTTPEI